MFLPPDAFDWALKCSSGAQRGHTILIDAGLGADPELNLPRGRADVRRLEAAGIDLEP